MYMGPHRTRQNIDRFFRWPGESSMPGEISRTQPRTLSECLPTERQQGRTTAVTSHILGLFFWLLFNKKHSSFNRRIQQNERKPLVAAEETRPIRNL